MTTENRRPPTRVWQALSKEPRVQAESLGVSVVRDLVDSIVSGTAQPGNALPPEPLLGEEFAVSRTVIRESIKQVQQKGLIQVERGRGTIVSPVSNWNLLDADVLDAMVAHDHSLGILDELSTVRAVLEAEAAAAAASIVSDSQVDELRGILEDMKLHADDQEEFLRVDAQFHAKVMEIARSRLGASISRLLVRAAVQSRRYRGDIGTRYFPETVTEHAAVLDAIATRDPEAAREAMRQHILVAWERRRPPGAPRDPS